MLRPIFYPFYPERIFWTAVGVLGAGLSIGIALLLYCFQSSAPVPSLTLSTKQTLSDEAAGLAFSFALKEVSPAFPLPCIAPELTFSFDSPRPDGNQGHPALFVRLKKSAQSNRISLPCRIGLQFHERTLEFAEPSSRFWMEVAELPCEKIQATTWIQTVANENLKVETFSLSPQLSPLQGSQEFPIESPFRVLSEAKWLGHNVFAEKYEGVQTLRIAVEDAAFDLQEKDWMVWSGQHWVKGSLEGKPEAIARIEFADAKNLILEGWHEDRHVRLALPFTEPPPLKIKGEDLFTSIRIRSGKQISCMMEKHCLILRAGDWVLKTGERWRILRKKEEREAYRSGKMNGELFVFEKIELKQGCKFITGFLFNSEKSQIVPIDLPDFKHSTRKEAKEK